ncbi:expressed unknown protein [Seminavis robusta]|uniref:Uncharacterized protein n=1 Tax=Seminavis robusta TaxID=568900 RepID=A0A9N8DW08_9STRA|nr:expressed unknown protein [Seminavis robusta]|eukprot:Sro289_g109000.1 n/a (297) ;mRNA; r:12795-13685
MDWTCFFASLFVFTGNLLLAIWAGIERSRPTFQWDQYRKLDPDFLESHWNDRRDLAGLHLSGSFIIAISWVLLTIPLLQAAFILSHGGRRMIWLHTMIAVLAVAAATTEFVSRLMHIGSWNTGNWISRDFYLDDWGGDPQKPNGIGWKSLEITYQLTQGMILWVDSFEYFALFGICFCLFLSIRTSPSGLLGGEMCWGGMGFFIGMLSLADFVFLIVRFVDWDTYNLVSMTFTILIRLILLPSWLLLLAFKLPPAVHEFNERRAANPITSPLSPSSSVTGNGSPRSPQPSDFTIED